MSNLQIDYDSVAEIYDLYVTADYDIPFFLSETANVEGPVLELTAGTGRLSLPLVQAGVRLTCVDGSQGMLDVLARKLKERGLHAELRCADICHLQLQTSFQFAILPFQSFMEIVGEERQRQVLSAVFACLTPGGRFVCTLHNPVVRRTQVDGVLRLVGRFPTQDGTLVVSGFEQGGCPVVTRLQYFEFFGNDGHLRSKQLLRMEFVLVEKDHFECMARDAGFRVLELYGNYDRSPFDAIQSPVMIWVLQKGDAQPSVAADAPQALARRDKVTEVFMPDALKPQDLPEGEAREDIHRFRKTLWSRLRFYAAFVWRFVVLQRPEPLIYGVAVTDRCNLACRGCHVSNAGRPDMTWDQLVTVLQDAWSRGFRELYFSGGEPMLWRDAAHTLKDAIAEAKRIGFFHVHVYTNGLLGLEPSADLVWVSMDGLPGTFDMRRGNHFHQVEHAVRTGPHPKVAVIYVIDRNTAQGVEPFLQWVAETKFPILGVMFYFHTPYYGRDELFLTAEERAPIIDRLLDYIRAGLPILNSRAGLLALKSGNWPRRFPVASVIDVDGESVCCRASDEVCADCGYAACTELTEFQRLRPSALLGMTRYW